MKIPPGITPRELSVAYWTAQGKTHAEIGTILNVSPRTSRFHTDKLKLRFGDVPLICAIIAMVRAGLLDIEPPNQKLPSPRYNNRRPNANYAPHVV